MIIHHPDFGGIPFDPFDLGLFGLINLLSLPIAASSKLTFIFTLPFGNCLLGS
jgi:hypothetical protein